MPKDHSTGCIRLEFWDAGEWDAPCTCSDDNGCWETNGKNLTIQQLLGSIEILAIAENKTIDKFRKNIGINFIPKQILVSNETYDKMIQLIESKSEHNMRDDWSVDIHPQSIHFGGIEILSVVGIEDGKMICLKEPFYKLLDEKI